MSTLYISNLGSEIHLDMDNIHLKYLGPKSLEKFIRINNFDGQVISVETQFTYGAEEEYITTHLLEIWDHIYVGMVFFIVYKLSENLP